jgi:hypothetical protein
LQSIENYSLLRDILEIATYIHFSHLQIWSLNKNDPKHVLKVDSDCQCLVWNSSGYGNDLMEETTQKTLIAWFELYLLFFKLELKG